jgi:hypothetical protein
MLDAGLAVGRVQVDVGEADVVQGAGAEGGERFVETCADPRDLALGDAGVRAQGFDQARSGTPPGPGTTDASLN